MATTAHPLLATGPAAEGFGPALSVILNEEFEPHIAGSLVYVDGLRPEDGDTFKRRKTSANVIKAEDAAANAAGGTYLQPAFFVDSSVAKQDAVALQTYGVLTVKVETDAEQNLPGPGTVLTFANNDKVGGAVYTVLKAVSTADEHPAAFVLNAEWMDGQPHTHCICRVFVSQILNRAQGGGGGARASGTSSSSGNEGFLRSLYNRIAGS